MKRTICAVAAMIAAAAPAWAQDEHEQRTGEVHPASVIAFHDVMAPDWHADEGAARTEATCANVATYQERAEVVTADTPPEGVNQAAWRTAADALAASAESLGAVCAQDGRATFEAAFSALHDRFHDLVALTPGG